MALIVKDGNGNVRALDPSAAAAGLGTSAIGKEFEVAGNIVSRASAEAGGSAVGIAAEAGGTGSLWTNAGYDPARAGSGWRRTITMVGGNVGIGKNFDPSKGEPPPSERLVVQGNIVATGDVQLAGADCAEEFAVSDYLMLEPGTVLVIGDGEELRRCDEACDTRVAGVLSGAGDRKPGIVLGKRFQTIERMPVALAGTVFCRVDAHYGAIRAGDLLTTSPTPGHAMKATDGERSRGAILGKALRPLEHGQGLIPVLVALQ
jgi:hypothetical protein